jgi:hypothetical protein
MTVVLLVCADHGMKIDIGALAFAQGKGRDTGQPRA